MMHLKWCIDQPEFDDRIIVPKKSVKTSDLSALTAKTGDEFAMFTRGSQRLIVRGSKGFVNIDIEEAKQLAKQGYKFSGHTHPCVDYNGLGASDDDYEILKAFGQKQSVTYNAKGQPLTFELEEVE